MAALPIIFMGTPELAGESLRALLRAPELRVVAVVTQPDQPKGRGLKLQPSPVKEIALQASLPVLQPERARDEGFLLELRKLQPELIAVAAYGQLLPQSILDLPRFGCLNVHTSLLPKYRGAAPIQHAILNGDAATGVTIMKMDAGLDTGDIVAQETTPIQAGDNSQTLHDRLAQLGAALLVKTIPGYVAGSLHPRPQPADGVSHAAKIRKQDGRIDWHQPARAIWNRVRAFTPWPGAFTHWFVVPPLGGQAAAPPKGGTTNPEGPSEPQGQLLKIWQAELLKPSGPPGTILQADKTGIVVGCGAGSLRILVLQREGGRRMSAQEFLAGHPLLAGQALG
jgi:methionyl-tRNA formyltransferase